MKSPAFLFERRADIEASHHWLLAGVLWIDIPKEHKPRAKRYQHMVNDILEPLVTAVLAEAVPTDGLMLGWPGDEQEIDDDELVEWQARSLTFLVRARMREDGHVIVEVRPAQDEPPTLH